MPRAETHPVQSPALWRILISPVRAEIAEAIRLLGPCSVADIAAALDRPADSLYKHIEILQKAGFVTEAGFRKTDRNVEQLLDVVADYFQIDFKDSTGLAENAAFVATVNSFTKSAARAVRDSAAARQLNFHPDHRNVSLNIEVAWLTPEDFLEVRSLIRRLKQLMDAGKKRRQGRLYLTLALSTPITRKRGARNTDAPTPPPVKPARKRLTVKKQKS